MEKVQDIQRDKTPAEVEAACMPNDLRAVQQIRAILEPFNPIERNAIIEFVRSSTSQNPYAAAYNQQILGVGQLGAMKPR